MNLTNIVPFPALILIVLLTIQFILYFLIEQKLIKEAKKEEKQEEPLKSKSINKINILTTILVLTAVLFLGGFFLFWSPGNFAFIETIDPGLKENWRAKTTFKSSSQCQIIKFFNQEKEEFRGRQLQNNVQPGEILTIAVKPENAPRVGKARLRINTSQWSKENEITQKDAWGRFIVNCSVELLSDGKTALCGIPAGAKGKFLIEAEIYDSEKKIWK